MKNKILALMATIGLASSVTAVEINENLSINGFIDGSYSDTDVSGGGLEQVGIDEIELNFLLNAGSVSGELHIDSDDVGGSGDNDLNIEQAHFTYTLDNGLSFTFGRYGSVLGLEREDPAGLYTFSRAYGTAAGGSNFNFGDVNSFSREGLALAYATGDVSLGLSFDVENDEDLNDEKVNVEVSASYTGIDNLVLNIGYRNEDDAASIDYTNINAAYSAGKALIAAEWSNIDTEGGNDDDAYLVLLDYDFTDTLGGAIRYSEYENGTNDITRFTVAPNYALTDSLGVIVEYSDIDNAGAEEELLAVELTFTF